MPVVPLKLPRIQHPVFPLLVPSMGRAARFRPFTVKEEKILLMAKESDEPASDHLRAIHQVVGNCAQEDLTNLATFDFEWLFLKLRAASVGPTIEKSFVDNEERDSGKFTKDDLPIYTFTIRLDDVIPPVVPPQCTGFLLPSGLYANKKIVLESGDSVDLRYPPADLYVDGGFAKNPGDAVLYRSTVSITSPTHGTFEAFESTQEEIVEYYDSWSTSDMELVRDFLDSTPSMTHEIEYKNSFGHDHKIRLTSLSDFFTF